MRKKLIVLCIFIIFFFDIFCFSGCINQNETVSSDSLTLNIGLNAGEYNITYPFKGYYTQQMISINSNIYDSLVEFDENYNIIPSLAQSWYNPNNTTWRFNLRKDVKFHNGYNLTAEDVKYTMEKIKEDKNNSIFLHFSVIDKINIINNDSLEIITKVPDPLLLRYLTYAYIISEDYCEQFMNIPPIGTGPYKFYNYSENKCLILKGFNDYWSGKPTYNDVTITFYNTFEDKLEAVCNGDVDIIDSSEKTDINNLSKIYGIKMISIPNPNVFYLSFDFRKNNSCCFEDDNPVADVRIRKAIYHAIDINDIVENNTYVFAVSATQFVNEYIIGYNPNIERLTYNLDLARKYMMDAGFEHGFEIDLVCRDLPFIIDIASRIASQLADINITVNLNVLPRNEYVDKVYVNRNSSLYLTGWQIDSGDAMEIFNDLLRSVNEQLGYGIFNYGYYANPQIDMIADDIKYEMNNEKRVALMQEGFGIVMDEVACIPLISVKQTYLMKNSMEWSPRADKDIKINDIKLSL